MSRGDKHVKKRKRTRAQAEVRALSFADDHKRSLDVFLISSIIAQLRFNTSHLETTYQFFDLPNNMYKGTLAVEKRDDLDYDIGFRDGGHKEPVRAGYYLEDRKLEDRR